jgi:predicted PurR-regulated permease PerM
VTGSVLGLLSLLVTFYLLFYFLRDRKMALNWLREMSPLSSAETNRLFARIVDTIEATVYGTVTVAVVQGALGGLIFWWLDLMVMGVLAIVPVLGAFVVCGFPPRSFSP